MGHPDSARLMGKLFSGNHLIKDLLPDAVPGGRPRTINMRKLLNAILYVTRGGIAWRLLPHDFTPWQTVYGYFRRWTKNGAWQRIHSVSTMRCAIVRDARQGAKYTRPPLVWTAKALRQLRWRVKRTTTPARKSKGASGIYWWILFASASRGVLLAWIVDVLVTAGCYRQLAWPLIRLQLTSFITGLSCYGLLFYLIPSLLRIEVLTVTVFRITTNDRIGLWKQAWSMIQAHPWLAYAWYPNAIAAHPHNSVLQLAAEWGLPATVLILALAGYRVCCRLKRFNSVTLEAAPEPERNLAVALFFTFVSNDCYSLVDGVIVMPLSQVMMAVIVGLMSGL